MATRSEIRAMVLETGENLANLEKTVDWMEKGHKKTMLEMIVPIMLAQQKILAELAAHVPVRPSGPDAVKIVNNPPDKE